MFSYLWFRTIRDDLRTVWNIALLRGRWKRSVGAPNHSHVGENQVFSMVNGFNFSKVSSISSTVNWLQEIFRREYSQTVLQMNWGCDKLRVINIIINEILLKSWYSLFSYVILFDVSILQLKFWFYRFIVYWDDA